MLAIIAAVLLLAILNGQTKQGQSPNQSGRFQLFAGEISPLGFAGVTDKMILRIDTQTGNVDQWIEGQRKDGTTVDMWARTGEIVPKATAK